MSEEQEVLTDKEKKAKPKKILYYCNEGFVYKEMPYQEHQVFDGSSWGQSDLEAALRTHLIKEI